MAVLLTQDLPIPIDIINAVSKEMGVADDPPAGLIVHVSIPRGDSTHIVDVWETREHYERFAESRLGPAVAKAMQANGMEMAPGSEPVFEDAEGLVLGR